MIDQYEEHLRDSQFDDSRFAGFDRGDPVPMVPASQCGEWDDIEF